jgi:hypothetical protein
MLKEAREKGCRYQVGTATPDELRAVAKVAY